MPQTTNIYDALIDNLEGLKLQGKKSIELSPESYSLLVAMANEAPEQIAVQVPPSPVLTAPTYQAPKPALVVAPPVQPVTNAQQATTSIQQPGPNNQTPTTSIQQPASSNQAPTTSVQQPIPNNQAPTSSFKNPFDFGSMHKNSLADLKDTDIKAKDPIQLIETLLGEKPSYQGGQNKQTPIVFITEYNHIEADQFANDEGIMLTKMIEAVLKVKKEDIFLIPLPKNASTHPDISRKIIEEILGHIKPKVTVSMGVIPLKVLFQQTHIHQTRGQEQNFSGYRVIPTYSSKYLVRNPSDKRSTWNDLLMALAILQG